MKTTLLFLLALIAFCFGANAQNVNIPDAMFKNYLVQNTAINTNEDEEIQISEANSYAGTMDCSNKYITDLTGIEAFIALTELNCKENELATLDVTQNIALTKLFCGRNNLTTLFLPEGTALDLVNCYKNNLTSIAVSQCAGLGSFNCSKNNLTSIDVSQNSALTYLDCDENNLTTVDVSHNSALVALSCGYNNLTNLDITHNPTLVDLFCSVNSISALDLSQNLALVGLSCSSNALTALDFSQNPDFNSLICFNNFITALDLSDKTQIVRAMCSDNALTSLNVANGTNESLYNFQANNNPDLRCIEVDNVEFSNLYWGIYKDSTATFSINCGGEVGIENQTIGNNITIYPNPGNSQITIDTKEPIEIIEIYNLMGAVVQTEKSYNFNVEDLSQGVYIFKVKTAKGTSSKRFVRN